MDGPHEHEAPPMFRCKGVSEIGAARDGGFGYVELTEVSNEILAVAFPPAAATELANRILSAGELAHSQEASANPEIGARPIAPAPLATEHTVVPAEDGDTILLTLMAGAIPLVVRLSKSRSEKLRASLERGEGQIG